MPEPELPELSCCAVYIQGIHILKEDSISINWILVSLFSMFYQSKGKKKRSF